MALSDGLWSLADPGTAADSLDDYTYLEYRESGKESYTPGNSNVTRVFLVNWDQRGEFLDALLGFSYLDTDGTTIHRITPDPHPEIDNFYAEEATVEGKGVLGQSDSGSISWTVAVVTANYRPVDYAILEDSEVDSELDRYVSHTFGFTSDILTVTGGLKFETSGTIIQSPPGILAGLTQLEMTWHEVPAKSGKQAPFTVPNIRAIQSCLGKVNSAPFDVNSYTDSDGNKGYPAGTVLFSGVSPKLVCPKLSDYVYGLGAQYQWEITFNFLVKNQGTWLVDNTTAIGHNFLFDLAYPGGGQWDRVVAVAFDGSGDPISTGRTLYQATDLNALFQIDS
ncbi:MAG TPA: hypothetical protein VJ873_10140 [bacterium]|nr:hypothetical protein [bacterium]